MTLPARICQLIAQHGGLRPAARAVRIDAGYLLRLKSCEKYHPSDKTLKKLGLFKVISTRYFLLEGPR